MLLTTSAGQNALPSSRRSWRSPLRSVSCLSLIGCLASAYLLFTLRGEMAYALSAQVPLELGAQGDYRWGLAVSNRYARIQGVPTTVGTFWQDRASTFVAVGLLDTPLLVARVLLPTESWKPGERAPQPDQRAMTVRGRLLSRADARKYEDAFAKHEKAGEVVPRWLLIAEERPGGDFGTTLASGALGAFCLVNLWLLMKGLLRR
jgi:hypothetical protein